MHMLDVLNSDVLILRLWSVLKSKIRNLWKIDFEVHYALIYIFQNGGTVGFVKQINV